MNKMKRIFLLSILIVGVIPGFLYSQAKTNIAVLSFEAKNVGQETADAVADILSTELFNTNRFNVVERQMMTRILEEQQLSMTGITDASQAAEIGKILNVEKIMIGSLSKLGNTFIINSRVVDVETGAVELAQNSTCQGGEDQLPKTIASLVATISQKITVEGSIIRISPTIILVDLGSDHGIKKNQLLEVIREGDVITDLNGSVIGKSEDKIGNLRVKSVKKEYSETEIVQRTLQFRLGDKVRLTTTPVETPAEVKENIETDSGKKVRYKQKKEDDDQVVEPPPPM